MYVTDVTNMQSNTPTTTPTLLLHLYTQFNIVYSSANFATTPRCSQFVATYVGLINSGANVVPKLDILISV